MPPPIILHFWACGVPWSHSRYSYQNDKWIVCSTIFVTFIFSAVDIGFLAFQIWLWSQRKKNSDYGIILFFLFKSETLHWGNRPILMAPKFGLDDGSTSNFDTTLVLATMLTSQLHEGNPSEPPPAAATMHGQAGHGKGSQAQERPRGSVSDHPSDHTRIWSDISGTL